MKSKGIAYILWIVGGFGILGLHRFYLEKIGTGILWLFTGGLLGIGALIDLFTLGSKVDQYNTKEELKTLRTNALFNSEVNLRRDDSFRKEERHFEDDGNQYV